MMSSPHKSKFQGRIQSETNVWHFEWLLLTVFWLIGGYISVSAADDEFFSKKVLPILESQCLECHSHESKIRGGLSLDSRRGIISGGNHGPGFSEKSPQMSLLLQAIRHEHPDIRMPKNKPKLNRLQIQILEQWFSKNLPDPRRPLKAATNPRDHWAFKPVKTPTIPTSDSNDKNSQNSKAKENPVDQFIRKKLEEQGMVTAERASSRVLVRRVAFDLTGLPPTFETVKDFERDDSPQHFEQLVERYLSSPGFGERWGRHWLDVARYADTRGYVFTSERRFPYSYTYRDYVITSFNEDKPYDQFLKEQIAADHFVEETGDKSSLAALGFLTLGRSFLNNKHDIIDDRIDVVTRGMMGLTVVCARCHDHKYDPVSMADYYGLYGIFDSSKAPDTYPLLDFNENDPKYIEFKNQLSEKEKKHREYQETNRLNAIEEARKKSSTYFDVYLATQGKNSSEREDAARSKKLDPGILNNWFAKLDDSKNLDESFWKPWKELKELRNIQNFSEKAKVYVTSLDSESEKNKSWKTLIADLRTSELDGFSDVIRLYGKAISDSLNSDDLGTSAIRDWIRSKDAPPSIPISQATRLLDVAKQQKIRALKREVEKHIATHPGAPPRGMALVDKASPVEPVILERGNPGRRGRRVPRQFLGILTDGNSQPYKIGSGRKELALDIASKSNPLTARVFVNRVWGHLFGNTLVATPSDLGVRSEAPVHKELLDFLAWDFMENNWSIKQLLKTILTSQTYQQKSFRSDGYEIKDPDNNYIWKMNRKRLEFEPMRDQTLLLAGRLNRAFGGLPVNIFKHPFEPRRTIYGFIERQNLPGVLKTFDFASPDTTSPKRFTTMVPQQSLFMMNNDWFQEQAKAFAENAKIRSGQSLETQINTIFKDAYQRKPSQPELDSCLQFIKDSTESDHLDPLAQLAQAILMSNEAQFVD